MIIRLDKEHRAEVLPEDAIVVGNNLTNTIKVFMYDGFSFKDNNAYANFEINEDKKYTDLIMQKSQAINEVGVEEKCFFYSIPKFLAKKKGIVTFSIRLSPLRNQKEIANTKTLIFKIDYAVTADGEEILDPTTVEELRYEIGQAELNANNYTDEVALKKVDKDFTNYPILEHKDIGAKDVIVINKVNEDGTTTIHKLEAQDLYNDVNGIKPDDKGSISINSNDIPYKDTDKSITNELDNKLNLDDDVVHYKESPEDVGYPLLTVTNAEYAEVANKDNKGNVIYTTYVRKDDKGHLLSKELYDGSLNLFRFNQNFISSDGEPRKLSVNAEGNIVISNVDLGDTIVGDDILLDNGDYTLFANYEYDSRVSASLYVEYTAYTPYPVVRRAYISMENTDNEIVSFTIQNKQTVKVGIDYNLDNRVFVFQPILVKGKYTMEQANQMRNIGTYKGDVITNSKIIGNTIWKNNNPNVELSNKESQLEPLFNTSFEKVVIKYRQNLNSNPTYITFDNSISYVDDPTYTVFSIDKDGMFYRDIQIKYADTGGYAIFIGDCYKQDGTINNAKCIILEVSKVKEV